MYWIKWGWALLFVQTASKSITCSKQTRNNKNKARADPKTDDAFHIKFSTFHTTFSSIRPVRSIKKWQSRWIPMEVTIVLMHHTDSPSPKSENEDNLVPRKNSCRQQRITAVTPSTERAAESKRIQRAAFLIWRSQNWRIGGGILQT